MVYTRWAECIVFTIVGTLGTADLAAATGAELIFDSRNPILLEETTPSLSSSNIPVLGGSPSDPPPTFSSRLSPGDFLEIFGNELLLPGISEADVSQRIAQNLPSQPDRDRFLQPSPTPQPTFPGERPVEVIPPEEPPPTPSVEEQQEFEVQTIEVVGSTILSDEEISAITEPFEGQFLTLSDLSQVANNITGQYLEKGYITSRAVIEPQRITNGFVTIRVIEGSIEAIHIDYTEDSRQRLRQDYIRNRLQLGISTPLNVNDLEEQLRLLLADPLIENIEPILTADEQEGQSLLTVLVTEADAFSGSLGVDNYSPPSIGSVRFGANGVYQNLTGIGDRLAASVYRTASGGNTIVDLAYRVPVNPMDGTLQVGGQINRNEITESPLDEFDVDGESERIEVSYRQPVVRSLQEELAFSLGFAFQDGQTFVFDQPTPFGVGPDEEGRSRTSVFSLGQDYVLRDAQGAWSLRSLFNFGTGLFNATTNDEPIPDSHFFSWLGQVQRVQRLGEDHLLLLAIDLQFSPNSLLSSEQFVIGGGQSVRGYRQNARSGDSGVRFSLEDRITLQRDKAGRSKLQLTPFVDVGAVWNQPDNPNQLPEEQVLVGAGLGVLWRPLPRLSLQLNYGFPFIDLGDRGNDIQNDGLYFDIRYGF